MASFEISFVKVRDEGTLMLTEDYERGGNKSTHTAGEKAYVRIYPSGSGAAVTASGGTWKYSAKGLKERITEHIAFADESSGKLKYPVAEVISVSPAVGGTVPYVGGRYVRFRESRLGSVSVTYETSYDVIEVTGLSTGHLIIKADGPAGTAYCKVDYTGDETDLSERMVIITTRDAASREAVPYAQVFMNGTFRGVTNSSGMLNLGRLKKGMYSLLVRKEGYLDTDMDNLRNDSFRIE